MKWRYSN